MELYNYNNENNNIDFEIKIDLHKDEGIADNLRKFILIYESPYNSPIEINNNIYAELFIKDNFFIKPVDFASETFKESSKNLIVNNFKYFNKNIPLLIFLHGFSTKDEKLKNYYKFISSITNSDIACLFINLPFHLNRRPVNEASGERLIYYDDVDTLLFFHQCVVDIKKSIDIINNILSPSEINICGISLGSMVSVITMAVDNRIDKGILILGGGNWEEIHWNGILKFILKGNCAGDEKISREKCHNYYLNFPEFVKKLKTANPDKITTEIDENFELKNLCTKKCYLCDPLAFAYKINPQKVLMINSKIDLFFSKKSTLQLWKELGKPEIHWYVYPHLSMIINKKEIFYLILKFLNRK